MKAFLQISITTLFCLVTLSFLGAQTQVDNDIDGEAAGDESGYSVSMSSDGSRVAIGAPYNDSWGIWSGHVRVYEEIGGNWIQEGPDIVSPNDKQSGWSVSLSSDGTRVAIGAPDSNGPGTSESGHVRIYDESGGGWTQVGSDIDGEASQDRSGTSVSLSSDGTRVAIGAWRNDGNGTDAGHVRIYEESGGTWTQAGSDIDGEAAEDRSGYSVSMSFDGTRVAIGAPRNDGNSTSSGHVRIYEESGGVWTQIGSDIDGEALGDQSGYSVSLSSDGTRVAIGAPYNGGSDKGHVRIYEESGGNWSQVGSDIDGEWPNNYSGWSVSLSSDGTKVAIGAIVNDNVNGTDSGHVRIYEESGGNWTQMGNDIDGEAQGDRSGHSVSLSADGIRVGIGARYNTGNGTQAGHVRVYEALDGPLPIELKDFVVKKSNQSALLIWHTSSETNSSGFDLQHSVDGINWNKLDFIENKGDTEQLTEYQYLHPDPAKGINYYRLKMIDLDGSYEYSDIVSVQFDQLDQIRIFPNPTSGIVKIIGVDSGTFKVYNSLGKLLLSGLPADQPIYLSAMPPGIYFINIQSQNETVSKRVLKE